MSKSREQTIHPPFPLPRNTSAGVGAVVSRGTPPPRARATRQPGPALRGKTGPQHSSRPYLGRIFGAWRGGEPPCSSCVRVPCAGATRGSVAVQPQLPSRCARCCAGAQPCARGWPWGAGPSRRGWVSTSLCHTWHIGTGKGTGAGLAPLWGSSEPPRANKTHRPCQRIRPRNAC